MFDARRLQCLHAVHRHGSVLDAALELGLTSSAVSQQIGKLETEVGTRLLQRAGRGVMLTDAARVLVQAAEEITAITERATAQIEDLRHDVGGTLRVGCFPTAIGPYVAPTVARLQAQATGVQIEVTEMFPDRATDAVLGGHIDVAVIHLWGDAVPTRARGFTSTVLVDDPVHVILPAGHRFAGRGSVGLDDLVDEVWVADDLEGFYRTWLTRRMSAIGRRPAIPFRVDEIAAQLALIREGLCIGLLPRLAVGQLPASITSVELADLAPFRRLHVLHRETASSRPLVRSFVEGLEACRPV